MPPMPTAADSLALAATVDALGGAAFGPALLAWLRPTLDPAHVTAFLFDADLSARVVLTASAAGGSVADASARLYAGSALYRRDRLALVLQQRGPQPADAPLVVRLRRTDIIDPAYGRGLWDRFGLLDRLSALDGSGGRWLAFNVYRDGARGTFSAAQARGFAQRAPLLLALLRRHLAAREPGQEPPGRLSPEAAGALLQRLPVRLSPREREVCAMTLAGHTREGIGLSLGIAASSVATLRARAYRKLRIHGTGELFALCLQQAQPPAATATATS